MEKLKFEKKMIPDDRKIYRPTIDRANKQTTCSFSPQATPSDSKRLQATTNQINFDRKNDHD